MLLGLQDWLFYNIIQKSRDLTSWLHTKYSSADKWNMQETEGAVIHHDGPGLDVGGNVAGLTYADYTAGANWSNPSDELARHTAGSVETLQQNDIIAPGKTWRYPVIMSNRTAGNVAITGGDVSVNSNGTTIVTITAIGTDVIVTPTSDFDGDLDLAQMPVQQTGILASSSYPGEELLDNKDLILWTGAFPTEECTNWTKAGTFDANNYITQNPAGHMQMVSDGTLIALRQTKLTIGKRYVVEAVTTDVTAGAMNVGTALTTTLAGVISEVGKFKAEFIADNEIFQITRNSAIVTNLTFKSFSIREADPMNGLSVAMSVGNTAGGNLGLAYGNDGATGYGDILSAELISKFNPNLGTAIIWGKSTTWAAGDDYLLVLTADGSNRIIVLRSGTNLVWIYGAGGTDESFVIPSGSPSDEFMLALTWEYPGNVIAYYNAIGETPQVIANEWLVNLTLALISAGSAVPTNAWNGKNTRLLLDFTRVYTPNEIANIYARGW